MGMESGGWLSKMNAMHWPPFKKHHLCFWLQQPKENTIDGVLVVFVKMNIKACLMISWVFKKVLGSVLNVVQGPECPGASDQTTLDSS